MSSPSFRALTARDSALLCTATLANLNWSAARFTMADVRTRPEFARYTRFVPTRGDFGFVAVDGQRGIGLVWALFLPQHDAGYGFVSDQIPELSLWVHHAERGRGLGAGLLARAQAEATARQLGGVGLSVEAGNRAKRLYQRAGFVHLEGREADGVMLWSALRQ